MKLRIHPSLILWLSVLFYLEGQVLLPFLAAAGLHELGHYLALRLLGKPPRAIALGFSGASMETGPLSYREELLAAAAGPAVNLLLVLLFPLWPALGLVSLGLACFNLLPIPGLDGGRILEGVLGLLCSEPLARRLTKYTAILTALCLWGGALYLSVVRDFGLWPILLSAVLLYRALSWSA